eukprot:scaffold3145_cov101-Isochrysis_galbana.AAC.1
MADPQLAADVAAFISSGGARSSAASDPYNEPNDWEQRSRGGRGKGGRGGAGKGVGRGGKGAGGKGGGRGGGKGGKGQRDPWEVAEERGSTKRDAAGTLGAAASLSAEAISRAGPMVMPVTAAWWDELEPVQSGARPAAGPSEVSELRSRAEALYEREQASFAASQAKKHGSDAKFVAKLIASGTIRDRIAALQVQVQESAFHALPSVRQLVGLAQRPRPELKLKAVEALLAVFLRQLLPQRPLTPLDRQPLPARPTDRQLMQAYFEGELKALYAEAVDVVVRGAADNIVQIKQRMVSSLYEMLSSNPELERTLLPALVNKLGDPEKKVASRLTHLLGQLTQAHPAMKAVVLAEVQRFVLRPNVGERAQYYAVIYLNQLILTRREPAVAQTALLIYLALFAARAKDAGALKAAMDSRMLSALLSGIHRAVPFCNAPADVMLKQLGALFRCAHAANFSVTVQALMILSHAARFDVSLTDRFYNALYESLLHPGLPGSAKLALFLNVLYKGMKADSSEPRRAAFAKRLLQLCAHAPPPLACGALVLVSEVSRAAPALRAMLAQPQSALRPAGASAVAAGALPGVAAPAEADKPDVAPVARADGDEAEEPTAAAGYDWQKRNPLHAGADRTLLWDVHFLTRHFHPSVAQFAANLRDGQPIEYRGDPLTDFQLGSFLDKFVFKNPKRTVSAAGGSIMQPVATAPSGIAGSLGTPAVARQMAQMPAHRVAPHERFFHTYFEQRAKAHDKRARSVARHTKGKAAPAEPPSDEAAGRSDPFAVSGEGDSDAEEDEFARQLAEGLLRDEEESEDGDEDDSGGEEEEGDDEGDDEDDEAFAGMDVGGSEEEQEEPVRPAGGRKAKRPRGGATLADAAEFAHILEEGADTAESDRVDQWQGGRGRAGGRTKKRR